MKKEDYLDSQVQAGRIPNIAPKLTLFPNNGAGKLPHFHFSINHLLAASHITMRFQATSAFLSTSILLLMGPLLGLVSTVLATDCKGASVLGVGCWVCGKAVNKTPWTMLYTTDPHGSCSPGASCCQILNWDNGGGSFDDAFASSPKSKNVVCGHIPLGAGGSKGGNTCSSKNRLDVDAVTFADRDWVISTGGSSPKAVIRTKSVTKGVWVKISSLETLTCREKNGKPFCIGSW